MPSGRKASLNRFLTQIEGGTGVLCLLSYSPSLGSHQQIQHRQLPPENQATEGKDVLELQGRGPQMERTNRWSARSFQRLQTISSSISSLLICWMMLFLSYRSALEIFIFSCLLSRAHFPVPFLLFPHQPGLSVSVFLKSLTSSSYNLQVQ